MNPATGPFPEGINEYPEDFRPDVDDLVTEDDTPVDNVFSEERQRLLTESLYRTGLDPSPHPQRLGVGDLAGGQIPKQRWRNPGSAGLKLQTGEQTPQAEILRRTVERAPPRAPTADPPGALRHALPATGLQARAPPYPGSASI